MVEVKRREHSFWKWFAIVVIVALLAWGVWAVFFSYAECDNWDCFNNKLKECEKVVFIGESGSMIFEYIIKGVSDDECKVSVELLQGELNNQDSLKLQGHKMICYLPEGVIMIPESNIAKCTGLLKEGLQDAIIKRLHSELVQNLGRINLEVLDTPEVK